MFNQFGIWNAAPEVYGYLEGEGIKYAIRRNLFADILRLIAELWPPPATPRRSVSRVRQKPREVS